MSWRKYMIDANWNIGFCEQTPENLIQQKKLNKIQWLKHPYKDRWFADPFIYKVTDDEIIVFVEECNLFGWPKGIICELVIDRKTISLKERHILLELDTHLSYPAIIRHEGKVYVYPENGASRKLNIYEYDSVSHKLVNPICILNEAVADASIIEQESKYLMIATKCPETQEKAYLYQSKSLLGPFVEISTVPFQASRSCSRPGGNWIDTKEGLFRPAQDCSKHYGGALSIMSIQKNGEFLIEKQLFQILPQSFRYNKGVHTLNFCDGLCVIDGYGYLYQIAGRFFDLLKFLKRAIR